MNDGQALDDAKAENANWLEFVNGSATIVVLFRGGPDYTPGVH
ncbi:MAG: hypothetical protein ACREQ8_10320 [Woeseiaceae bacterium]